MRPFRMMREGFWEWSWDKHQPSKGKERERENDEEYDTLLVDSEDGRPLKHPGPAGTQSSSIGVNICMNTIHGSHSASLLDKGDETQDENQLYGPTESNRHRTSSCLRRTLTRAVSSLGLYVTLQVRYRLGITLVPTSRKLPRRFLRSRRRSICVSSCIYALYSLLGIPILLLLAILVHGGIPPSYSALRAAECALPQHHWDWNRSRLGHIDAGCAKLNTRSECSPGTFQQEELYLRFPDSLWGHGLNNVLQERILTTHLTLSANRTPVFEDYTWSKLPLPYTVYDFALRPTRIPLGAFVGGVLSGQESVREQTPARTAISSAYFDFICPPSETVEITYRWHTTDVALRYYMEELPNLSSPSLATPTNSPQSLPPPSTYVHEVPFPSGDAGGSEIIEWFKTRLEAPDVRRKRCVVVREERKIFDSNVFGGRHMLAMLPELLASPVLKQFQWSTLVLNAIERNIERYFGVTSSFTPSLSSETTYPAQPSPYPELTPKGNASTISDSESTRRQSALPVYGTIPGVLALHLRRGDYQRHCTRLNSWGAGYMGVMGVLKDKFDPDGAEAAGQTAEERYEKREAYYLRHCLPSVEEVVVRLREVRAQYETTTTDRDRGEYKLKQVYVLTNAWPSFLVALREALVADGWERVVGTADLEDGVELPPRPRLGSLGVGVDINQEFEESSLSGLNRDERGVGVAIDMGIAERAQAFVGNGFSSLSANTVILRLARGFAVDSNRLL